MALELRIPPVALVIIAAALMWLIARLVPAAQWPFPGNVAIAVALLLGGATVALAGVLQFRRAGTTVNPMTPNASSALVTGGVYRWTRNPMYLGFLMALLAWAAFLVNVIALVVLPGFVLYMNRFQIAPEERALRARFGPEFENYCRVVRPWL